MKFSDLPLPPTQVGGGGSHNEGFIGIYSPLSAQFIKRTPLWRRILYACHTNEKLAAGLPATPLSPGDCSQQFPLPALYKAVYGNFSDPFLLMWRR